MFRAKFTGKSINNFRVDESISTEDKIVYTGEKADNYDGQRTIRRISRSVIKQYERCFYNLKNVSAYEDGYNGITVVVEIWK